MVKPLRKARKHVKTRQTQVRTIEVTGAEISPTQIEPAEDRTPKINSSEVASAPIGAARIQRGTRTNRWQQIFRGLPLQKVKHWFQCGEGGTLRTPKRSGVARHS